MIHGKVIGGTPVSGESLCKTCRAAQVIRGLADSSESVLCRVGSVPARIGMPIIECSLYDDKRQPSRWDMEQIAWVLVTNKAGKAIGFVSAADFQKSQQQQGTPSAPTNAPGFAG
jgi:hypothetical protein